MDAEYRKAIGIASLVEHREQRLAEQELIEAGATEAEAEDFMLDDWRWSVKMFRHGIPMPVFSERNRTPV